ncbi:MAG: DUF4097 domain-containing protein [Clostridiales bacterium]|nr:DUF4097 domain-containing protein [Clostridiales bacterium]
MKPSSIIFLILSLILIIGGIITCVIASAMAKGNDLPLFSQVKTPDGDLLYTCEYDPENINRIELAIDTATINVFSSEEDKIELLNFTEGSYSRGITSQAYVIDENFNLSQLFVFDQGGFSFSGLRQYFRNFSFKPKEKTINVYISSETIKSLSITLKEGVINIDDVSLAGDFNLNVTEGKVNLNNVSTSSYVKLSGDNCTADIKGGNIKSLQYTVTKGELKTEDITINAAKIALESGDINLNLTEDITTYMIEAKTDSGKITVDGSTYQEVLLQGEENEDRKLDIKIKSGNIVLS